RAVGGERHPIAAALVGPVPQHLPGDEIEGGETSGCRDVETPCPRARSDALDVLRGLAGREVEGREALHEPVAGIDVVDEDADPSVLDVVADARHRHVEVATVAVPGVEPRREKGGDERCEEERGPQSPRTSAPRHGSVRMTDLERMLPPSDEEGR